MRPVYLDYAATAPLLPEVRRWLTEAGFETAGNPSSLHRFGRQARMELEQARERCAAALKARVEEIVFTSGATESDNLALSGALAPGDHFLVSAVEHPAVLERARWLAREHRLQILPVDARGLVAPEELLRCLRPDTRLVSVMWVNNELGTIQPIAALGAICREHGVLFHVDAVQAAGFLDLSPERLGIDLLSLSGHKLGGLSGSGLLYVRRGLRLASQLAGGGQEDHRRAGTPNLSGAASLGLALERAATNRANEGARLGGLKGRLERGLSRLPGALRLSGAAPHISAWRFAGLRAEAILVRLDLEGIAASSGSACSSHSLEPSHVLQAMGASQEEALGLVRFSMGWQSKEQDVDRLLEVLPNTLAELAVTR
ncbi:cysteine desulfurase [bacterium CPR1]|nr:cysteine desulfurase [bacterium CPR1]